MSKVDLWARIYSSYIL